MNFIQKLYSSINKSNSLVCIGLDSDIQKIPKHLLQTQNPLFEFNKSIIDSTHDLVCAYKPNSAFYEALGDRGVLQLKMTCDYINHAYPHIPIILDAKRADIASTNIGYVSYAYNYLGVDAITLNPYLGKEALLPFLQLPDKGAIILCKTSNSGAGEIQDLQIEDEPLYKIIAKKVASDWNKQNNCLLVLGATYPEELREIRQIIGDMTILVPGVGAQGGDIQKTLKAGLNSQNSGLIIHSSRSIIYASDSEDFAQKAKEATLKLKNEINKYKK